MKKRITLLALALALLLLPGCGAEALPPGVDIDLSRMSSTMIYSTVSQMVEKPASYMGKVIRIAGYYSYFDDMKGNALYHACMVPDAMACCSQGLEFVLKGEHTWPDDYPEEGTDILITGTLDSYTDGKAKVLHLVDCEMVLAEDA